MPEVRETARYARWFDRLRDAKAKSRILVRIVRLSLGNPGDAAPVGAGVSELRIDYGPGYRVFFVAHGEHAVLLAGGDKRTQEKDVREAIRLAANL